MKQVGIVLIAALVLLAGLAKAQEQAEMPPMGPPQEVKDLNWLIGTWDVDMQAHWQPTDTTWLEMTGVCAYEYILDGAAVMFSFGSEFMGMPFRGRGLQAFDRETQQWQMTWIDNMSGRISFYTGPKSDGETVVSGEEIYMGQKMLGRLTTAHVSDTEFTWKMENSADGGKTWWISGQAVYTKRK